MISQGAVVETCDRLAEWVPVPVRVPVDNAPRSVVRQRLDYVRARTASAGPVESSEARGWSRRPPHKLAETPYMLPFSCWGADCPFDLAISSRWEPGCVLGRVGTLVSPIAKNARGLGVHGYFPRAVGLQRLVVVLKYRDGTARCYSPAIVP